MAIALRLKALADPVRVKLISLLFSSVDGEVCNCDLASAVGLSESTVSHHLTQWGSRRRKSMSGADVMLVECSF